MFHRSQAGSRSVGQFSLLGRRTFYVCLDFSSLNVIYSMRGKRRLFFGTNYLGRVESGVVGMRRAWRWRLAVCSGILTYFLEQGKGVDGLPSV